MKTVTKKAIVVEAEEVRLAEIRHHLEKDGWHVIPVASAEHFKDAIRKHSNADLVIAGLRQRGENNGLTILAMAKRYMPKAERILFAQAEYQTEEVLEGAEGYEVSKVLDYRDIRNTLIKAEIILDPDVIPDREFV